MITGLRLPTESKGDPALATRYKMEKQFGRSLALLRCAPSNVTPLPIEAERLEPLCRQEARRKLKLTANTSGRNDARRSKGSGVHTARSRAVRLNSTVVRSASHAPD